MRQFDKEDLDRYLNHLRHLAFVKRVDIRLRSDLKPDMQADGVVTIKTPQSTYLLDLEIKRSPTTYTAIAAVIGRHGEAQTETNRRPLIIFAPHISRPLAQYLVNKNVNFVDEPGNCHLRLGTSFMALIEGRTAAPRALQGRGIGLSGHLALFAVLAKPDLLSTPLRTLAEWAGVSKTAVEHLLARLTQEGAIVQSRNRRHLQDKKTLLDRWLSGYSMLVRPRLLVGQYRTQDADPSALEQRIELALADDRPWGWGGGTAANRLVGYYRGSRTILHMAKPSDTVMRSLKGLPSNQGELILLRAPGRAAFEGAAPRTVHPLLVYTELLIEATERARESAEMIRERYLPWL